MGKLILTIFLCLFVSSAQYSQWILQTSGNGFDIFSVSFPSLSTGYICGYGSLINKTTNGGSSWINLSFPSTQHNKNAIFFTSENTGYMCSTSDTVLVTTNGGATWTSSYYPIYGYSLQFINPSTGWAGGGNKIIRTTNAGANWTVINVQTTGTIFFADAMTGWMVSYTSPNTTIHKSTNGGFSWTPQYTTIDFANIYSLCFINSLTGWAAGYREIILKTTNGGVNWTEQRFVSGGGGLYSIDFTNENNGWIAGEGKLLHTPNGGVIWDQVSLGSGRMNAVIFLNDMTGWTAGQYNRVYKTTNNGGFTPVVPISNQVPDDYKLFQNYPNPFNPKSNIKYQISKSNQNVQIAVFDIQGKEVIKLVNEVHAAGTYEVDFDGTNLPSGIYFYSLITDGSVVDTKKMILLR